MIGVHAVELYANREAPTGESVDVTCLIDEVAIRHGRDDSADQPEAASATFNVAVGPGAPLPTELDIGAWLVVTTMLGATSSTRFVGRVTDIAIGWDDAGINTPEAGLGQIVAVSPLADFARRIVGQEAFPQELDGARMARIFAAAGLELDPATSDPGTVELIPREAGASAALEMAQSSALSAGGLVWHTREGETRYADTEHRRGTDIELDLDACDILVTPSWQRNLSGLVNEVSIGYGFAPEGGQAPEPYTARNTDSRARFGEYAYSVTTELATLADASAAASLLLTQNGFPAWLLQALPIDVASLTTAETQALLSLDVHGLIRVSGLPVTGTTPTAIAAWVEGWNERLAWGIHELELSVSDYCRTAPPIRWDDLPAAQTWNATPGTWDDAACTGAPLADLGRWNDVAATTRWDQVSTELAWDEAAEGVPT